MTRISPARKRALAALRVIDRHDRSRAHASVADAYRDLAQAMDEIYGPLPANPFGPLNPPTKEQTTHVI